MQSSAQTVTDYLAELSEDRRKSIQTVRKVIKKHLPKGYKEVMQYGHIGYVVPLKKYPKGYLNKADTPLPYISLANQKNYMAIYFMGVYGDTKLHNWFVSAYKKTGKRLDMGKSCVRFKTVEDLPLELIGKAVAAISMEKMIDLYEEGRKGR